MFNRTPARLLHNVAHFHYIVICNSIQCLDKTERPLFRNGCPMKGGVFTTCSADKTQGCLFFNEHRNYEYHIERQFITPFKQLNNLRNSMKVVLTNKNVFNFPNNKLESLTKVQITIRIFITSNYSAC